MKPLTDYAVYKENNEPWTVEEIELIAKAMGDTTYFNTINDPMKKYVYLTKDGVYNWNLQTIGNKTPITYTDFLKLVQPNYLTRSELQNWEYIQEYKEFTVGCTMLRTGVSTNEIHNGIIYTLLAIVKMKSANEMRFVIKDDNNTIRKWISPKMWSLHIEIKNQPHTGRWVSPTEWKTITKNKQEKQMKNRQGKYLSLKVKDGEANVRDLIYQANATNINDPRPYIQELISNEKKRLKQKLNDLDLASIDYGFNVKLASLVTFGKNLQKEFYNNPNFKLSLPNCINIYNLIDELLVTEMHNVYVEDPYKWIADYLTPAILNVPKPKVLFTSNKLTIKLQDGCLYYTDHKSDIRYKAEIKLDVKSNTYYI